MVIPVLLKAESIVLCVPMNESRWNENGNDILSSILVTLATSDDENVRGI